MFSILLKYLFIFVVEEVKETTEKVEDVKKETKKTLVANTSFNDKYTGEKYTFQVYLYNSSLLNIHWTYHTNIP